MRQSVNLGSGSHQDDQARLSWGRPTALIHEVGHEAGFALGWNEEVAALFGKKFGAEAALDDESWAGWSSDMPADTFAALTPATPPVAGLHDVIDASDEHVLRRPPGGPHPPVWLRG